MIPLILLSGKFNIGKTSFFNTINYSYLNLFSNFKSLTLDKKFFFNILHNLNYLIIDTLGYNFFLNFNFNFNFFIYESDLILFFFDNFFGILYEDKIISVFFKKLKKYVFLIINKFDFLNFNINIFYFFKFGFNKPYLISSSNHFNIIYSIFSILNIFCFLKNCFYFKKKINKFKIFLINLNNFKIKNFLNFFFNKKYFFFFNRDILFFNFKFNKLFFFFSFFLNFNKKKNDIFIKNFLFLKFIKNVIISNLIIIIINPLKFYKLILLNFLMKYSKSLIFFIDSSKINLISRIYFKNFFIKKFFLYFYYIFFIFSFNKNNYFYFIYYINKVLYFFSLKFFKNLNFKFKNFLIYNEKTFKFKLTYLNQRTIKVPLITILSNLKNFKKKNLFKKNFYLFFKIKSIIFKFNYTKF